MTAKVKHMPESPSSAGRDLRDLVDPVVVMAFGGWNDAGNAATGAVEHLAETYQAESVYALDPDDFYDFQVNRPRVEVTEDDEREITWPTTELKIAELAGRPRLGLGPRPGAQSALAAVQHLDRICAQLGARDPRASAWCPARRYSAYPSYSGVGVDAEPRADEAAWPGAIDV